MNSNPQEGMIPVESDPQSRTYYAPSDFVSPPTSPDPYSRGYYNQNQNWNPHASGGGVTPMTPLPGYTQGPPPMGAQNYSGTYEKPMGAPVVVPVPENQQNAQNMPIDGAPPPPTKTILGMRKKVFWIVVAIIALLAIAGLGAGLGIALGGKKKNNDHRDSDRDGQSTTPGLPSPTPDDEDYTPSPSPSPEETDPVTPLTSPSTPTPSPTPVSTPGGGGDFSLAGGYATIVVTMTSTAGNICDYFVTNLPLSTTIYPYIQGDNSDGYTASWNMYAAGTFTGYASEPTTIAGQEMYTFEVETFPYAGSCSLSGTDVIGFRDDGAAALLININLDGTCTWDQTFAAGAYCQIYWDGAYED